MEKGSLVLNSGASGVWPPTWWPVSGLENRTLYASTFGSSMATPMRCWRHHFRTRYYWKPHRCWKESQWSGIPVGMEPWRFNHSPRWHYANRGEACNEKISFFDVIWIDSSNKTCNSSTLSPTPALKSTTVLHFHLPKRWNWRRFYIFTDPSDEIDDSSTLCPTQALKLTTVLHFRKLNTQKCETVKIITLNSLAGRNVTIGFLVFSLGKPLIITSTRGYKKVNY